MAIPARAAALAAPPPLSPPLSPMPATAHTALASSDGQWAILCLIALSTPFGIGLLATGLSRAKSAAHTMTLALLALPLAILAFAAVGFALMCGGDSHLAPASGWLLCPRGWGIAGGRGFLLVGLGAPALIGCLAGAARIAAASAIPIAATAERWRIDAFACFTAIAAAIIFPIGGCWVWGGGWLARLGAIDAGGSGVIHLQGAAVALIAAWTLGPRAGKYDLRGRPRPMLGHHLPLAMLATGVVAIGVLALNLLSAAGAPFAGASGVLLNSLLAAAAGAIAATALTRRLYGRPDPSLAGNGLIAGLVAVAAGCAIDRPWSATLTGAVAGCLIVPSVLGLERRGIDDPVGAIGVHGVGGVWGMLAVSLMAGRFDQLLVQGAAVVALFAWPALAAAVSLRMIGWLLGSNRIAAAVESAGLDVPQLGVAAYPEFLNPLSATASPHRAPEPRPAHLPTPTTGRHRYAVVVEGVDPATLIAAWSALCQARATPPPPQFTAVYPFLTTVSGTRFRFNGGDPAMVRASLGELLGQAVGSPALSTRIENGSPPAPARIST